MANKRHALLQSPIDATKVLSQDLPSYAFYPYRLDIIIASQCLYYTVHGARTYSQVSTQYTCGGTEETGALEQHGLYLP